MVSRTGHSTANSLYQDIQYDLCQRLRGQGRTDLERHSLRIHQTPGSSESGLKTEARALGSRTRGSWLKRCLSQLLLRAQWTRAESLQHQNRTRDGRQRSPKAGLWHAPLKPGTRSMCLFMNTPLANDGEEKTLPGGVLGCHFLQSHHVSSVPHIRVCHNCASALNSRGLP